MVESFKLKSLYTMHGGVFQIKVPVQCMVEQMKVPVHNAWRSRSFKLKSLYTMHGGVFQIKVPVHNAWWSLSN